MAFGQLNKRCKDGSRRFYEDEIRSVEGPEARRPFPERNLRFRIPQLRPWDGKYGTKQTSIILVGVHKEGNQPEQEHAKEDESANHLL